MQHFFLLLMILSMFLTGCFRYCPKNSILPLCQTDLQSQIEAAGLSESIVFEEFCDQKWWVFFGDCQLGRLIETALSLHPDIQMAEARIRLAENGARLARSALFPHLFLGADVQEQKVSEFGEGFVPGFPTLFTQTTLELTSAVYELDIWQKNRSQFFSALDLCQASVANYEEAKLILSTSIAAVYFDLMVQLKLKELIVERIRIRRELNALAAQRLDSYVASAIPLLQSEMFLQQLLDTELQIENAICRARNALAALTARSLEGQLETNFCAQFDRPFPLPASLPIDLLARRPDIVARKWVVEGALCNIKSARANFFPRIDLMGYIGFQSIFLNRLFEGKTLIGLADAAAKLPLFLAGKLQAELGIAHEGLEIAISSYNEAILRAVQQVSDALSDLLSADERAAQIAIAAGQAEQLSVLAQQKYASAVINRGDYLYALDNFYAVQERALAIQLSRYEAAVDLILAIGGGYCE